MTLSTMALLLTEKEIVSYETAMTEEDIKLIKLMNKANDCTSRKKAKKILKKAKKLEAR